MRYSAVAAVTLLGTAVLTACGDENGGSPGGGDGTPRVAGVHWVAESVTVNGERVSPPSGADAHVTFRPGGDKDPGGKSGGNTGCNHLGADVRIEGHTVRVSDVVTTGIGCSEPLQRFEKRFLEVFHGTLRAEVSDKGDSLTLTGEDGDRITFSARQPEPPAPLKGTTWKVTGLIDKETVASVPAKVRDKARFTLGKEGGVSGNLGCNTFTAHATVRDGRIAFDELVSTRRVCSEPVMKVERAMRAVLSGTVDYDRDGRGLTLKDGSGKGISAKAAGAGDPAGAQGTRGGPGKSGETGGPEEPEAPVTSGAPATSGKGRSRADGTTSPT